MGHTGVRWVMQGWGGSCRGGVGHAGWGGVGIGWACRCGVGWVMQEWGQVGHPGVWSGGSYRGNIKLLVLQGI